MTDLMLRYLTFGNSISDMEQIKIGFQTWTIKNLDVNTFRNGDAIAEAKTKEEWLKAGENKKPAWCYYDNNPINGEKYGKLYNWYAVNDPSGLAPKGWHVPSGFEWWQLTQFLGQSVAGAKMKINSGWKDNGNGTDESGFKGLPSGERNRVGIFDFIGVFASWWSSSEPEYGTGIAIYSYLSFNVNIVHIFYNDKVAGFSIRCLKD